jgi:hypothetical protein
MQRFIVPFHGRWFDKLLPTVNTVLEIEPDVQVGRSETTSISSILEGLVQFITLCGTPFLYMIITDIFPALLAVI